VALVGRSRPGSACHHGGGRIVARVDQLHPGGIQGPCSSVVTDSLHGRGDRLEIAQDLVAIIVIAMQPPLAGTDRWARSSWVGADGPCSWPSPIFRARLLPWLFGAVSRLGSPELFLLTVFATALLTAFVSSAEFGPVARPRRLRRRLHVSESTCRTRPPVRDLRSVTCSRVLFIVSVGILVDRRRWRATCPRARRLLAIVRSGRRPSRAPSPSAARMPLRSADPARATTHRRRVQLPRGPKAPSTLGILDAPRATTRAGHGRSQHLARRCTVRGEPPRAAAGTRGSPGSSPRSPNANPRAAAFPRARWGYGRPAIVVQGAAAWAGSSWVPFAARVPVRGGGSRPAQPRRVAGSARGRCSATRPARRSSPAAGWIAPGCRSFATAIRCRRGWPLSGRAPSTRCSRRVAGARGGARSSPYRDRGDPRGRSRGRGRLTRPGALHRMGVSVRTAAVLLGLRGASTAQPAAVPPTQAGTRPTMRRRLSPAPAAQD